MSKFFRALFLSKFSIKVLTLPFAFLIIYGTMYIAIQAVDYDLHHRLEFWYYSPIALLNKFVNIQNNYRIPLLLAFAGSFIAAIILIKIRYFSKSTKSTRHGDARWATDEEIKQSGMLGEEGIIIGKKKIDGKLQYLRHPGPEPIINIGPTRSGKGVAVVIPNLLEWRHSVIIYDPKGENWDRTAATRKTELGNKCLRFAPGEMQGVSKYKNARYNFLDTVKIGGFDEVATAETLANIICDTGDNPAEYWDKEARSFIKAVILHIVYTRENGTLTDVAYFVSESPEKILYEMITTNHAECLRRKNFTPDQIKMMTDYWGGETNKNIYAVANPLHDKLSNKKHIIGEQSTTSDQHSKGAEAQLHGILGNAISFLSLYQDRVVASNISHSDFNLEDLYDHESPVSLYIVVPPSSAKQERFRPLVRLMLSLIIDKVQENMAPKKHKMLCILDEFPTLKRMTDVESAFSTIAGYGFQFLIIIQDIKQLEKHYGQNQSFYANAHVRLIFATADEKTQKIVSNSSGTFTYVGSVISRNKKPGLLSEVSTTESMQESPKPLVTTDQVAQLPMEQMYLFINSMRPIKCCKANYLLEPKLLERSKFITNNSDILNDQTLYKHNDHKVTASIYPQTHEIKSLQGFTNYYENTTKGK